MTLRLGADDGQVRALVAWRICVAGAALVKRFDHGLSDVHRRQHGNCYLCIAPFVRSTAAAPRPPKLRTRDHVFPRRAGGGGEANILWAHDDCNQAKGDRWPYPCEVIYLAAVYLPPLTRTAVAMRRARMRAA